MLSLYETEIINNEENFYNLIYSGSLFSNKKIITIFEATDKIMKNITSVYDKYTENVFLIIFSGILEKKSKLRNFFETSKKTICIPCYLDSEKDLEIIAQSEFRKNNISLSREAINLLIEKSNSDRGNLKNEIAKIISYSLNKKKIGLDEIKSLINFAGDYKSDILINECLCGNISQYKKIISELYINTINQILLLRILGNKVHRLLNIKEQENKSNNLDKIINVSKPAIFWKEKPLVKKQLSIWSLNDLKKIINGINNTELLCKQKPQMSKTIFFNFFLKICVKANNFS
jgi:DNA polymerase-3 subunit delta